jgi:hypothetical protein
MERFMLKTGKVSLSFSLVMMMWVACLENPSSNKILSGVIRDVSGIPLPGATVKLKVNGASSHCGSDGRFSIALPDDIADRTDTVQVSDSGFFSDEKIITAYQQEVDFILTAVKCPTDGLKPNPNMYADPQFDIIEPNGGETFYVGDSAAIVLTSQRSGQAIVSIGIGDPLTGSVYNIPGLQNAASTGPNSRGGIDTLRLCFYIPATFDFLTGPASFVSDSCYLKVVQYSATSYGDQSECYFSVKIRQ